MNQSKLAIGIVVLSLVLPMTGFSGNKDRKSDIFTEPKGADEAQMQLLLGLGDVAAIGVINKILKSKQSVDPKIMSELNAVAEEFTAAQNKMTQLENAMKTAASETHGGNQTVVNELSQQLSSTQQKLGGLRKLMSENDAAMTALIKRNGLGDAHGANQATFNAGGAGRQVEVLNQMNTMNDGVQKSMIQVGEEAAQDIGRVRNGLLQAVVNSNSGNASKIAQEAEEVGTAIANARSSYLKALMKAQPKGLGRFLTGVKVVGTTVFITDLAGRVIAWHWYDASPGKFPAGTLAVHAGKKAMEKAKEIDSTYHVGEKVQEGVTKGVESTRKFVDEQVKKVRGE